MKEKIEILTENLRLRYLTIDDTLPVMKMSREPLASQFLSNQVCETFEKANDLLKRLISKYDMITRPLNCALVLGVEKRTKGTLIGHVGLSPFSGGIEIGYGIGMLYQNKGYATEAVKAFTDWGLNEGGLSSVFGIVDIENMISKRVLEKSGYLLEGIYPGKDYNKQNECCAFKKVK